MTTPEIAPQDVEVLQHQTVVHVVQVEADRVLPGEVRAPGDLPEAGHAGTHVQATAGGDVVACPPQK